MGGARAEQSLCACYREWQEFRKVVELKDTGLIVYCHTTRRDNVQPDELIGTTISASQDAFVLHKTKDIKITPSDFKPTLEKNDISCPRCRQIFEHAQQLLQKVKLIERKNVIGVCDHCLKKAQSIKKPCCECEEIAKKFISTRDKQKEDTKRCIKLWLSKMSVFLKDAVTPEKKVKTRAYSDLQIDRLCQYSLKSIREPEVKQMFYPETRRSDTNLYTETNLTETLEKSVGFTQAVESVDTPFATYGGGRVNTITAGPWLVESDATLGEPHQDAKEPQRTSRKDHHEIQDQYSEYYESRMDIKESLKKKHDLSLRHMIRTETKTRTPFRPEIYEIPKIAPWEQETISKHSDVSEMVSPKGENQNLYVTSHIPLKYESSRKRDFKSETLKQMIGPDKELKSLPSFSNKPIKYVASKTSQKNLRESQQNKDHIRSSDNLDVSVMDAKGATKRKFDLNLKHMMGFERHTQDPSEQYRVKKYARGKSTKGMYNSEEIPKKIKKREDLHLTNDKLKYQHSVPTFSHETEKPGQQMTKTKIKSEKPVDSNKIPEYVLRKQFSYFFPKTTKKEAKVLGARSSQLIKNTQERLRLRAEEERKRHEEERKYQLEEEEKKKLAREERKRAEENKNQQVYMEDKKKLPDVIKYTEKESQNNIIREEEKRQYISKDDKLTKDVDKTDSASEYETKESEDTKKDLLKRKSEPKDKDQKSIGKSTKDIKLKTETIDKIDEISGKPKKELKSKLERRDKIDELSEKPKKELKSKLEETDKIDNLGEKIKKDLKTKPEQRDKSGMVSEKTKRDKSKSEPREVTEELSEKTKKDLKTKPEHKDQIDAVFEKSKKELKSKPEQRDEFHEVSENTKKGLKSKLEPKEKQDDVSEKSKKARPRDKFDEVIEKPKKDLKLKPEPKEPSDELTERYKRDSKSKSEARDKIDEVSEKTKKESKSKSEKRDTVNELTEKGKKDMKIKPNSTDKIDKDTEKEKKYKAKVKSTDKEAETSQKEKAKEGRNEQLQREKEDKDRLAQVAQLRKEKESGPHKNQDLNRETEEAHRKEIETSNEKKPPSKKSKELSKENVEPSKKGELTKKLKEPSVDTEAHLKTKEWTSKELQEFSKKRPEMSKEAIAEIKQGLAKEVAEPSKKKHDSIKEKESASKGKEIKNIPKKDEPAKMKEESKDVAGKVADASKKSKDGTDEAQFRKLQTELAKQKEEDLKNKKLLDIESQKIRDLADKRAKEEGERKPKGVTKEAKAVIKPEPKRPSDHSVKKVEESVMKDLKIHDIKIRNRSSDDLILRLVRIKQTATRQTIKPRPCDIDPEVVKAHKCHHKSGQTSSLCELCNDSELEIDVESYEKQLNLKKEVTEIIIGEKIYKHKPSHLEKVEEREVIPILFQSIFQEEPLPPQEIVQNVPPETETVKKPVLANFLQPKDSNGVEPEPGRGIIRYALSDRTFIDKGWTMLPTEKVVRKMNVYRMRPAHPEFDWFEHNKNKRLMNYDSGEKLAEFDDNGRGRWYYRSGRLALDYYDAEETNAQQRFVIYSSGEPDERGRTHPITILATFDYLGNGIVFDHAGKIRLKYNQTEGVVLDRGIGPVSHWKWHTLNDPPVLQQVMIDTQMAHKDPAIIKLGTPADTKTRPDNEEMLAIEFDNFIKEKSKKLSQKFKPFQIKMKALKINEHFSLKVLDQATIYLIFRDGSTNLKLNIGMILDHQEIVDTDTAEVGEVSNNLERFPARTDSLAGLQRSVAYAQRYERQRTERERRLRPPEPCASADHLTAAASPPLRLPLRTMPAGSTSSAGYCNCRKPANNLYYNTRLL